MRALATGALIVLAIPAAARADVGVVVLPAAGAPVGEADLTAAVAAALGDQARPRALAEARRAADEGAVPAGALEGFARVAELIDEGWRAYLEVQTEFAVARLGEARRHAEALLPLDGGLAAYAEAALRLGAALDNAGRKAEADEVLRLAAVLDPGRAVTVQEFSPDVVAAHARAVGARPATRAVTLDAPGLTVEIDGAPASGTVALAVGQHVVVARAPGRAPRGQTVSIADDTTLRLALDPDPRAVALDGGAAAGQDEATAAAWVDATLVLADLDAVVIAAAIWRSGRPALLGQWCEGAPVTCTAVVEIGYDEGGLDAAARAAVDELRGARGARRYALTLPGDERLGAVRPPPPPPRCRWCRPALYAGAGLAVAVVVTTLLLTAGDDGGRVIGVDPGDF